MGKQIGKEDVGCIFLIFLACLVHEGLCQGQATSRQEAVKLRTILAIDF